MRQLVPYFILKNYAEGNQQGTFSAAGLFVDTSGFSAMTNILMTHGQHGAEVLAGVMRATFTPMMQSIFEHGGFITGQEGDSFTALFPTNSEDGTEILNALAAAWDIQRGPMVHTTSYGQFSVTVKIGLAYGDVAWGIPASNDGKRAAYYFQGPAIDGSVEAESRASAGQIMMQDSFYTRAQEIVQAEPFERFYCLQKITASIPAPTPIAVETSSLDLASHFYPANLFTQLRNGEFRQVASLFLNLPTVRNDRQLRIFMQTVFDLVEKYSGILKLFFGDKGAHLMLFWGAPLSHENDLDRALNFLLELQTQTAIPVKGGLTYGVAMTGFVGSSLAEDFTAFGRGTNLAARMMTAAPRGEIWVDENIAVQAAQRYSFEPAGEQQFKGFSQPQKVFILIDRKETSDLFFQGPMIGREAELNVLRTFCEPLLARKYPGMLIVWGEPGMGKSRLIHEFLFQFEQYSPDMVQTFLGQSDEILRLPLNPFQYWLQRYFQVSESYGEVRSKRNFNRKLDDLIAETDDPLLIEELDRTRSFLGALIGLHWPDSLYEQLDARGKYENTFTGLATLLKAESLRKPVILFLEDLHWLDEDSKAFLPYLQRALAAQESREYPVAILATARFEGSGLPLDDLNYQALDLDLLNRAGLLALAAAQLQAEPTERLVQVLEDRAQGNPFFAEQILRYMDEKGLLLRKVKRIDIQSSEANALPENVGALLVARLDRLTEEVKEVIQAASVFGREFEVHLLAYVLRNQDQSALNREVFQAEHEGIINALSEIRYIFKHALMRDAAYQMQLRERQQALHALALEAFEIIYAANLQEHYGQLAYHAEQAERFEKARRYLILAGQTAKQAFQNSQALNFFTRALAITPEDDLQFRYQIHLECEAIYTLQANLLERQRELETLVEMLPALPDPIAMITVRLRQSSFSLDIGAVQEAISYARQVIALFQEHPISDQVLVAYRYQAAAYLRQGKSAQAVEQIEQGLRLARQAGNLNEESRIYNSLGMICYEQMRLDAAKENFTQSLQIAQKTGILRDQALPLNNLGMIEGAQGNYLAAMEYYEQALQLARKIGDHGGEGIMQGNLGFICSMLGEYEKAETYLLQNLQITREAGDNHSLSYAMINLASCSLCLGEYQRSIEYASKAFDLTHSTNDRSGEAWALTYLGHGHAASGDLASAEKAFEAAIKIRYELQQHILATEPAAGLARLALEHDGLDAAKEILRPFFPDLLSGKALEGTDDPLLVYLTCYQIFLKDNDPRAGELLSTAYQILHQRADRIPDVKSRQVFLHSTQTHRDILQARDAQKSSPHGE